MNWKPSSKKQTKIMVTFVFALIAALAYLGTVDAILGGSYFGGLDERARTYFDTTLKRAVFTFAVARTLNALISVAQTTTIVGTPAGVGVSASVGEVLDPINDLVESFSTIMLIAATSLGIQKILMEVGIWLGFRVFLFVSMVILCIGLWFPVIHNIAVRKLGYKLLIGAIIIRFCIPIVAVASDGIFDRFLKQDYQQSTKSLKDLSGSIKESGLTDVEGGKNQELGSWWDKIKSMGQSAYASLDIKKRLDALKDMATNAVQDIINLIKVFCLQTIIIPITILWIMIKLSSFFLSYHVETFFETRFSDALLKSLRNVKKTSGVTGPQTGRGNVAAH